MPLAEHIVERYAARARTYAQAREEILDYLDKEGWKLSSKTLRIPHATSPDGNFRLWFKTQAVYHTFADPGYHRFGDARSLSYDLDIRRMSPEKFLDYIIKERKRREDFEKRELRERRGW